jgi:hypothetical protein
MKGIVHGCHLSSPYSEGTGLRHVSLPWLQYAYTYRIEKTGQDSVKYGKVVRKREKKNKKRDKSKIIHAYYD